MPAIDPNDPRQPYEQIADFYRSEIKAGRLRSGDRLPSGREIAAMFEVAHGTATNAMNSLKDAGLIMSWQGRGIFVRDPVSMSTDPEAVDPDEAYRAIMNRLDQLQDEMNGMSGRIAELERSRSQRKR